MAKLSEKGCQRRDDGRGLFCGEASFGASSVMLLVPGKGVVFFSFFLVILYVWP